MSAAMLAALFFWGLVMPSSSFARLKVAGVGRHETIPQWGLPRGEAARPLEKPGPNTIKRLLSRRQAAEVQTGVHQEAERESSELQSVRALARQLPSEMNDTQFASWLRSAAELLERPRVPITSVYGNQEDSAEKEIAEQANVSAEDTDLSGNASEASNASVPLADVNAGSEDDAVVKTSPAPGTAKGASAASTSEVPVTTTAVPETTVTTHQLITAEEAYFKATRDTVPELIPNVTDEVFYRDYYAAPSNSLMKLSFESPEVGPTPEQRAKDRARDQSVEDDMKPVLDAVAAEANDYYNHNLPTRKDNDLEEFTYKRKK